jgi:hypothetical protein
MFQHPDRVVCKWTRARDTEEPIHETVPVVECRLHDRKWGIQYTATKKRKIESMSGLQRNTP